MNGKSYFCACCEKRGIPYKKWFKLGAQNSQSSGGYVYHCPPELRRAELRYVVNYMRDRDLYIAWDLSTPGTENKVVFWVLRDALEGMQPGELRPICKTLKHYGWGQETVYAFDRSAVNDFLTLAAGEEGE